MFIDAACSLVCEKCKEWVRRLDGNVENGNSFQFAVPAMPWKSVAAAELPAVRLHIPGIADGLAG